MWQSLPMPDDHAWTADAGSLVWESYTQDSGCHCDISDLVAVEGTSGVPVVLDTFLIGPLDLAMSPGVGVRVAGPSRIETAVEVSRAAFDHADAVVLGRADGYADALAAAPLAGALGGPVLLSPSDHVPTVVEEEILRLDARRVLLLGDASAIGPAVEERLAAMVKGGDLDVVERIGGANRYDTAALVADRLAGDHAYIVQGAAAEPSRGWPDAVAVAGLADLARSRGGVDTQRVWLATGRNWPDTLAAGPAAARIGALLLLADGVDPAASSAVWWFLEFDQVRRAWLVGGPDVLSPATAVALERRAAG